MAKWFKKIKFRLPRKFEAVMVTFMGLALFLLDIAQNQIQDEGLDYMVHLSSEVTLKATSVFYFGFMAIFILLTVLMFYAVFNQKGQAKSDYFIGVLGYFGLAIIFGTALIGFYYPPTFQIPFFGTTVAQIDLYHFLGIALLIIVTTYFSFTE